LQYLQGWLVGEENTTGVLVPFELAVRVGTNQVTSSGPVSCDVMSSFHLGIWSTQLLLHRNGITYTPSDFHLHLPLHQTKGFGPSCRLSFAHAVISAFVSTSSTTHDTVLTGDLNLCGDVLPVGGLLNKVNAACAVGFKSIIVPDAQPEAINGVVRIRHLQDLLEG